MTSLKSLTLTPRRDGETLHLALAGQIDEAADYTSVPLEGVKRVIFNFEGVKLINSTGLQRWIKFLAGLPQPLELTFTRCSIRVITQINMFPGFLAARAVAIESFYAPYFCEACDTSYDLLIDTAAHAAPIAKHKAPSLACPTCGGKAEFDGIERKYFLFQRVA